MLKYVEVGVLEADQSDIQGDNKQVDVDEVPNGVQGLPSMDVLAPGVKLKVVYGLEQSCASVSRL